ncbi:unnamed protein product [Caenorhabditis bovis]|uniref:poly(A)-specific ribonuclease n=1 Tax=Caenorhabditis bovis TaxID=2654633 RepID=A0A8S1FB53_9PELO|nr:unnamed protein product [Caenorhabditis bovis]
MMPESDSSGSATHQQRTIANSNNERRNSNGKRFVRRARRWAELQHRRQMKRDETPHTGVPEPPNVYDYVEVATGGDDGISATTTPKTSLGHRQSFPLHPRRQPMFYATRHAPCYRSASDVPIFYYSECVNEHGVPYISLWQTGGLPRALRQNSPSSSSDSMLSLITNDLSTTSIHSPNSSSSSSEQDDYYYEFLSSSQLPAKRAAPPFAKRDSATSQKPKKLIISKPLYIPPDFLVNTVPPPERSWVMIRNTVSERPIATFTALCYNVLCDKYATVNQYSYCPSWALNWEYRKTLILKEIRTYEADIITLQEVETEQFRTLFQPELKSLGYVGIFTPKSRAKTMSEEERKYVDGCAIFWKTEKFELERQHAIEFTSLAMKRASTSENMLNRVMPRDNIALCAVLKVKESVYTNVPSRMSIPHDDNVVGSPLVVCTAHIHWDPEFCDVKLVQTMMLAHEVSRLNEEVAKKFNMTTQQVPVLICGDLNSLPESGVFEFLSRGKISRRHSDLKSFRDDACLEKFTNSTDKNFITHPLRLDSAVDISAIPFTNYTLDFRGMIDYIFSTPQSLARLGILGSFDQNWVINNKILGFPHPHVPSDHIPIMAHYAIIPVSHQRQPPPPHQPSVGVIGGGYPQPSTHSSSFLR